MGLASTVVRSLREGALWVFGALALIVLAALTTYDRHDPSFATTGEPGPIANVIGPLGAHLAGLLVLLFGAPAFLFPVMIGFAGWLLYRDRSKDDCAVARDAGVSRRRVSCSRSPPAAGLRACTSPFAAIRTRPAACSARWSGRARLGSELSRRDAVAAGLVACGRVVVHRPFVDPGDGCDGPRDAASVRMAVRPPEHGARNQTRPRGEGSAQRSHSRREETRRRPSAAEDRTGRAQGREERARREGASGRAVRGAAVEGIAAAVAAR